MAEFSYIGQELEIFAEAVNWKHYFARHIAPYIRGEVLEVGAGIGANQRIFADLEFQRWTSLEPDRKLLEQLRHLIPGHARCEPVAGTLEDLPRRSFDAILYLDVLEHIEDDGAELRRAANRLKPDGALIVLAPAHPWLFTPFDAAVGHFRRYTKRTLAAAAPPELRREKLLYLDSAGLAASLANRLLLKRAMPSKSQIQTWDRAIIPVSRILDPLLGYRAGKSVLGIWRRD
ncbi:MAG TPA: class I SAM-dependent methyltransferase [Bryobacteraceae bacterium]|nr:class I SAM-dependent methyltransferase [Bryobacteraceae bacterium]